MDNPQSVGQHVPFVDLKRQGRKLLPEYQAAFASIVDRAAYVMGPEMREFEDGFAGYCGCSHALSVSSGTDALTLAYLAAGIGPGDEVIVPVNTFIATAEAVDHAGGTPVFVDCLSDTANIDPAKMEDAITERTKAVVPVHLFGQPADMDAVLEVAERHGLTVIEDACQAHGARYRGQVVGSFGKLAAFSFYPGKNLGALGDGGAVTTSDPQLAEQVRILRNHGDKAKSDHVVCGYCNRLDNIQAAFLQIKLGHLEEWNEARRAAAAHYRDLLAGVEGVIPVAARPDVDPVYHLFVVEVEERDRAKAALSEVGVETGIHYPLPIHLQPAYAHRGNVRGDFPVAERLAEHMLSLPMFPEITPAQIEYVVEQLAKAVSR